MEVQQVTPGTGQILSALEKNKHEANKHQAARAVLRDPPPVDTDAHEQQHSASNSEHIRRVPGDSGKTCRESSKDHRRNCERKKAASVGADSPGSEELALICRQTFWILAPHFHLSPHAQSVRSARDRRITTRASQPSEPMIWPVVKEKRGLRDTSILRYPAAT